MVPGLHQTLITKDIEDVNPIQKTLFTSENIQKQVQDYDESIQCFMFMNFGLDIVVETLGKKVTCISCLQMFGRIDIHWKKTQECAKGIQIDKFWIAYNKHKEERVRLMNRWRKRVSIEKARLQNEGLVKENARKRKKVSLEKARFQNEELA